MSITYSLAANKITVTGYSALTPCNFTDLWTEDKLGTLDLMPATTPALNMTLTTQIEPSDETALKIDFILASSGAGAGDTIVVTGLDKDSGAQSETIDVSGGDATYGSSKWFKSITDIDCNGFSSGTLTVRQNQWGVIWKLSDYNFIIESNLLIGEADGGINSYFKSKKEQVKFSLNYYIEIEFTGFLFIGTQGDTIKKGYNGSSIFFTNAARPIKNKGKFLIYDSVFVTLERTRSAFDVGATSNEDSIIAQSLFSQIFPYVYADTAYYYTTYTNFYRFYARSVLTKIDNVRIIAPTYAGIYLYEDYNVTIINSEIEAAPDKLIYALRFSANAYFIDCIIGSWTIEWADTCPGKLYRQYTFNLKVIDKDGNGIGNATVILKDKDGNTADQKGFETTTVSGGTVSEQTVSYGYYNQANGNTLQSYSPHMLRIYKYGKEALSTALEMVNTVDWVMTLEDDSYITEVNETTVSGYSGIDINYTTETITISGSHTLNEVYDYCQYDIIQHPQTDFEDVMETADGINFSCLYDFAINDGITISAAGKKLIMATGKTYNLNTSGQFTGIIADSNKTRVPVTVSNMIAGSRIQIYDTDSSTELYNTIEATTEFLEYYEHTIDINIRVRVMYVDGVNAYKWWTALGIIKNTGFTLNVSQDVNKPYEDNNIDGSTVTECAIHNNKIDINVDDPDNTLQVQRIYNWYQYYLSTTSGISDSNNLILATDQTHYTFDNDVQIVNLDTVNPLNLTGANIVPTSGAATNIFDLSNGASIALNFNRVEGFPYGTGLDVIETKVDEVLDNQVIRSVIITDASPTSLSFTTNLTETSNQFWQRAVILITSGDNEGQMRAILNYNGSTKQITLKTPLDVAPAQNDTFTILPERKYLTPDIEDIISTVYEESVTDHTVSGTFGAAINDIHDSELGRWSLDHSNNLLIYYRADGSILKTFTLTTTTDDIPTYIGRE